MQTKVRGQIERVSERERQRETERGRERQRETERDRERLNSLSLILFHPALSLEM